MAESAPLSVIVTPARPVPLDVTVPEMLKVGFVFAVAVKLTPVIFAPLTACALLTGVNVKPDRDGVMV